MAAIVEDVLATRLDLLNLGTYVSGFESATRAIGLNTDALTANQRAQLSLGVGAGAAGLGIIIATGKAALAAADEQADYNRAVNNFKGAFPAAEFSDFANQLSDITGIDDGKIASTLGLLGSFQVSQSGARELALPILNATEALKAQGATMEQIAVGAGKALETGEPTSLRRAGVIIDEVAFKAASAEQRIQMLATALNNQGGGNAAEAFRTTLPGAIQALDTSLHNLQEAAGGPLVGGLNAGANAVEGLVRNISHLPTEVFAVAGIGALALGGYLLFLSGRAITAFVNLGRLAAENIQLTNSALKAEAALNRETTALQRLGSTRGPGPVNLSGAGGGGGLGQSVGGFLRGPGGLGILVGGAGLAISALASAGDNGQNPGQVRLGQNVGEVLTGAGFGASLGAAGGPVGALVGGLIGGLLAELNFAGSQKQDEAAKQEDPVVAELRKANRILQDQLDATNGVRDSISGKDVAGATQVGIADMNDLVA